MKVGTENSQKEKEERGLECLLRELLGCTTELLLQHATLAMGSLP